MVFRKTIAFLFEEDLLCLLQCIVNSIRITRLTADLVEEDVSQMKTLHLSTEWNFRGGEQQVLLLVQGLQTMGHAAHLICQPAGGLYERALKAHVTPIPLRMRGEVDMVAAWNIARKIHREEYDIIHSHTPHALSLVAIALRMVRTKPCRVFTRRVEFSIFRHNFLGLNRFKYRNGTDHIIAISQRVKQQLLRDGIGSDMVSVAHSGVDVDRFRDCSGEGLPERFRVPENAPVLGSVGFLEENKGHTYLLQAIQVLTRTIPEIRLFLLGKGRLEQALKDQAHELGIEKNVLFPGFQTDIGDFLKVFDLLVVSSVEEGLNTSIMDALALKVPVVATNVGGIPEIITHDKTGFLVPPADPHSLAQGIVWMLNNVDQAKKLAEEGCRTVHEHFSAAAMVRKNVAVYEKLLRSRQYAFKNK